MRSWKVLIRARKLSIKKFVLECCISLVICPEIRKWVKICEWGFFRDDEKSLKMHCNWEFFVLAGVFCSKLLFFGQKKNQNIFLKILSKNLFSTPPKIDGPKSHQILKIGIFDDMCLMCAHTINWFELPWHTSELIVFVSPSYAASRERYNNFYFRPIEKKWSKLGGYWIDKMSHICLKTLTSFLN